MLLLWEGRPMSYDALVDAVWGAAPPVHVRNLVQKYVSGLRRCAFGAGPGPGPGLSGPGVSGPGLSWTGNGYRLTGAEIDDLRERRSLMQAALAARNAGELRRAGELAERAEALWRGEFAEGLQAPYLTAERLRWAEKRLTVGRKGQAGRAPEGQYGLRGARCSWREVSRWMTASARMSAISAAKSDRMVQAVAAL
jgi:hypothetical protein